MIDKFRSKQKFSDDDVQENVFITSTDVFLFYKNTLKSLALLTNRKPYLDLSRLFGKYLCILMDVLTMKLSKYFALSKILFC